MIPPVPGGAPGMCVAVDDADRGAAAQADRPRDAAVKTDKVTMNTVSRIGIPRDNKRLFLPEFCAALNRPPYSRNAVSLNRVMGVRI
ncbi:hypothetical protein J2W40_001814 [Sphingobium xenophagum]|uniref:Uncharacterized protein n=1 Tax=Sphingobium xenophagum TaxID=121428 RepID=A0ABU1X1F0_SPHXE|nr:hypothetical protein [Sphingobium xenophagum]